MKREIDGTFVDEEEGDIDDESDVELDGNDQLDLVRFFVCSPQCVIALTLWRNEGNWRPNSAQDMWLDAK